jgi:hypothetical protein
MMIHTQGLVLGLCVMCTLLGVARLARAQPAAALALDVRGTVTPAIEPYSWQSWVARSHFLPRRTTSAVAPGNTTHWWAAQGK